MDLPHEYAHARSHVKAIDFTYLVPSGDATFSNDLPPLSDLSLPPPENDEDGTYKIVQYEPLGRSPRLESTLRTH